MEVKIVGVNISVSQSTYQLLVLSAKQLEGYEEDDSQRGERARAGQWRT